jgi:hypothetical protein
MIGCMEEACIKILLLLMHIFLRHGGLTHHFPPSLLICLCGFVQVMNVAGASVVHPIKKPHHLFTDAIKEVKQQAAQSPSRQTGQLKQVGKALQDIHEAAANSLTVDSNSPEPPCASLQAQANSNSSLTSSDQDTVTRAEKNCLTEQPRLHDSRRGYHSPLAASNQAKSSSMIKVPQSHHGAAASSLTADICSSMGHVTKDAAPPQLAQIDPVRPHQSFSNTGQYQPLKGMAQGLRVSALICLCCG